MNDPNLDKEQIRRKGLLEFVRRAWPLVESAAFIEEPHIGVICRHLEACAYYGSQSLSVDWKRQQWADWVHKGGDAPGGISDLVIAIPPGFSKSLTTMVFFHAWVWTWCPQAKLITTSYSEDLALRDARRSFELMNSEWYRARWPDMQIKGGERASMSDYSNTHNGIRFSTPMGGRVTGRHAHFLLADDPVKPDDLKLGGDSAREALAKTHYRWDNIFSSRSADAATFCRVIIAQRLHMEDLSGHAIEQGAQHLRLPMEYEPQESYTSPWGGDWREAAGDLLAPKRFPPHVIDQRKLITSARDWAAQYQQRPSPEDGAVFQREWFRFRYIGSYPRGSKLTLSIDSSLKDGKDSDYTVIQLWATLGVNHYLVDQLRARMGFTDQLLAIEAMRRKWHGINQVLIEDKANGTAIVDRLKGRVPGVMALNPEGGKLARAEATSPLWMAGNVWLPEPKAAPWVEAFVEEHIVFPVGRHDDQVDAASQFLNFVSGRLRGVRNKRAVQNMRKLIGWR